MLPNKLKLLQQVPKSRFDDVEKRLNQANWEKSQLLGELAIKEMKIAKLQKEIEQRNEEIERMKNATTNP